MPSAPVSGHSPAPVHAPSPADAPEHDWSVARDLLYPAFRPVGTLGLAVDSIDREQLAAHSAQSHAQPLLDEGPAGLPVVYTIDAGAYDIVVNGDHLLSWGVEPSDIQDAALRNLADMVGDGAVDRRGLGRAAAHQLGHGARLGCRPDPAPGGHRAPASELGSVGRILIGLPERHLMTAGSLRPGDDDFATLFAEFIVEQSGGADEPIDRRVFELVDGRLVEFAGV